VKLSEYPIGTVIEHPQRGLYRRRPDCWSRIDGVDGYDSDIDTLSLDWMDARKEKGHLVTIMSVPWGLTETLIEMCYDFWLDNGYKVPEGDNPLDKVLRAAIENWDDRGVKIKEQ
jgi:hypothetical protein